MKLFHGSTVSIDKIDLQCSKPFKDFGRAFYLSDNEQQALELAMFRASFAHLEPVLNTYEFDERILLRGEEFDLNVKTFEHYSLEWAEFIWNNRDENQSFKHSFDIVYGPIADDTVGFQLRQYREAHTDLIGFLNGLKYKKGETFQYAFCSEKSLKYLKRI